MLSGGFNIKMNKKINIIAGFLCAVLACGMMFIFRSDIKNYFSPKTVSSSEGVKGSEFFENLGGEFKGDGNLGEGKYSYKALSDRYVSLKTLYLKIESSTSVFQDGELMDSKNENQVFRYKSKFKLTVKSKENELYCDGKNVVRYIPLAKAYAKDKMSADFFESMISSSPAINTIGLLTGADYSGRIKNYECVGKEQIGSFVCDIIKITFDGGGQIPDFVQKLWINEDDGIIIRNYYEISRTIDDEVTKKQSKVVMKVSNTTVEYKADTPQNDSEFVFVPKKDDREYDPVKEAAEMERIAQLMAQQQAEEERLAKEKEAEKAELQKPTEEEIAKAREQALEKMKKADPVNRQIYNFRASGFSPGAMRGKKLIIVFWAYGMGDEYLSAVSSFARKNKDRYTVVTVNINDESKELKDYVLKNKYSVPVYFLSSKSAEYAAEKLGLFNVPATYFVDEIGVVRDVIYGTATERQIEKTAYSKLDMPVGETVKEETEKPKEETAPAEEKVSPEIKTEDDTDVEFRQNPPEKQ